jgi:L-asparaginase/Glu-tRNA(Gln) amidotransferase subunit D
MTVLVLTTGGTIDSAAYPESGPPEYTIPSDARLSIKVLRTIAADEIPPIELDWIELCNKDSKHFNDEDQTALYDAILHNAPHYERIIVTIGTDRMSEIAQTLKARLQAAPACPIVFTGAIWPLANEDKSEGPDNLRLALLKAPTASPDIYLAIHGFFEPCEKLRKDFALRKFVFISEQ